MDQATMIAKLNEFDLVTLRKHLTEAPVAEGGDVEGLIATALSFVENQRRHMVGVLTQIDDLPDLAMAIAVQYVELKSRWIGFNTKMNYSMFRKGACDAADQFMAGATSAFLGHVEAMIDPADIEKITDFLSQPLNQAA